MQNVWEDSTVFETKSNRPTSLYIRPVRPTQQLTFLCLYNSRWLDYMWVIVLKEPNRTRAGLFLTMRLSTVFRGIRTRICNVRIPWNTHVTNSRRTYIEREVSPHSCLNARHVRKQSTMTRRNVFYHAALKRVTHGIVHYQVKSRSCPGCDVSLTKMRTIV